jgi:indole-3-glycerol phosphate synthase
MGTILDTILAEKFYEVAERQARRPLPFPDMQAVLDDLPPPQDFRAALGERRAGGRAGLIAEVKKASPSAGVIRPDFDPVLIAQAYAEAGADCLSVLTDERFFQGHDRYLQAVKAAVSLPVLRKDFVVDPYQIYEARLLGADAVLLIAAALRADQLKTYYELAQMLGLTALVEVHTEREMQTALESGAQLIGINSRDLKRFVTDLSIVETLAAMVPENADITLVAESGIKTREDVARVAAAGADAILVGETLMRSSEIGAAVKDLLGTV